MKTDPAKDLNITHVAWPKQRGPGSGKDAWVAFAQSIAHGNEVAWATVEAQSAVIADLQAEVQALRDKLASRKPKGGRPKVLQRTEAAIRADLAAGLSQRQAAVRNGVSAMTVSRLVRASGNSRSTAG